MQRICRPASGLGCRLASLGRGHRASPLRCAMPRSLIVASSRRAREDPGLHPGRRRSHRAFASPSGYKHAPRATVPLLVDAAAPDGPGDLTAAFAGDASARSAPRISPAHGRNRRAEGRLSEAIEARAIARESDSDVPLPCPLPQPTLGPPGVPRPRRSGSPAGARGSIPDSYKGLTPSRSASNLGEQPAPSREKTRDSLCTPVRARFAPAARKRRLPAGLAARGGAPPCCVRVNG